MFRPALVRRIHWQLMRGHREDTDHDRADSGRAQAEPALVFDRDAIRQVDRAAIEEFGVPGIVLMENAARGLARETLDMLDQNAGSDALVLIFCGSGNNGGDGYALARDLSNANVEVVIVPIGQPKSETDAQTNRQICQRMGLKEIPFTEIDQFDRRFEPDLIVDALFGTGLDRPLTGDAAAAIRWINNSGRPVLAVDVPSGLDCNTGKPVGDEKCEAICATRTVTFVGLKTGFQGLDAQKHLGEVVVVDIGAPLELLERFGHPTGVRHREAPITLDGPSPCHLHVCLERCSKTNRRPKPVWGNYGHSIHSQRSVCPIRMKKRLAFSTGSALRVRGDKEADKSRMHCACGCSR
jgi:NAD(P)H-hydrate epimerase